MEIKGGEGGVFFPDFQGIDRGGKGVGDLKIVDPERVSSYARFGNEKELSNIRAFRIDG